MYSNRIENIDYLDENGKKEEYQTMKCDIKKLG
jgi:hypothetical protein